MVRITPYTRLTSRAIAQKELFSARLNLMLGGKRGDTASRLGLETIAYNSCVGVLPRSRDRREAQPSAI